MSAKRARLGVESIVVDKASSVPAYVQIADAMKAMLLGGGFPAGYPLPPERILCENYGVSRMTLRQATSILEREGLIVSHRGRGTFVAHVRLRKQQQELRSFTEETRARGGSPASRLISFETVVPADEVRDFFGMGPNQKVYEVSRLRLSGEVPLAVEVAQIPLQLCPGLRRFDLAKNSLYQILEKSYGLTLDTCTEEISAEMPSPEHRAWLDVPRTAAVLVVRRKTFSESGQAIEFTRASYRGDLYSAVVHSVRPRKG